MSKLLLATAFSLLAAAFLFPAGGASAGDTCVNYAYVADYNWYYLCASTSSSCALYTKHVSGATETRSCIVSTEVPNFGSSLDYCTPYTGDMDHMFAICVVSDLSCPVYEQFASGGTKCLA